jgi:AcrR family transcriptional regulator
MHSIESDSDLPSRRDAILHAAIECIAEYGYFKTSTTLIAKRAGVSRALIHYHFESKEQLAEEAWTFGLRRLNDEAAQTAKSNPGLAGVARTFGVHFNQDSPLGIPHSFWLEYWAQASRIEELRLARIGRLENTQSRRTREFIDEIRDGNLLPMDPNLLSQTVSALVLGFEVQLAVDTQATDHHRVQRALDEFLRLIRPATAREPLTST